MPWRRSHHVIRDHLETVTQRYQRDNRSLSTDLRVGHITLSELLRKSHRTACPQPSNSIIYSMNYSSGLCLTVLRQDLPEPH